LATEPHTDSRIGEAVQDVSERVSVLVREEIELAKAELSVKAARLGQGAAVGAAAGVFAVVALLFILIGCALLFGDYVFSHWAWGFFIVALILLVLGAIAGFVAYRSVRAGTPPTPQLAVEEAKRIKATVSATPRNPES
jgi:Na+/melibiose symporter-like transporter